MPLDFKETKRPFCLLWILLTLAGTVKTAVRRNRCCGSFRDH